jgi:signal transduction histidine kinase/CheY-like chemotaxis protein
MLILLVTDNSTIRGQIQKSLSAIGHDVIAMKTAWSALELLGKPAGPDVVLVDSRLTDTPAVLLCRQIAELQLPALRVVLIDPEASAAGCDAGESFLRSRQEDIPVTVGRSGGIESLLDELTHSRLIRLSSEEELMAMFLHAPIPIFLVDGDGRVLRANRARPERPATRNVALGHVLGCVFSLTDESQCLKPVQDDPTCQACPIRHTIRQTLKSNRSFHRSEVNLEITGPGETVTTVDLMISASPVWIGRQKRVLIYLEDISDLRMVQKQLQRLNGSLKEEVRRQTARIQGLLDQKQRFIEQLGHDLRTPLTPLKALLPMVEQSLGSAAPRKMLQHVINNVEYMHQLVERTLDLIRLDHEPDPCLGAVDLMSLTDDILQDMQAVFDSHQLTVTNAITVPLAVQADRLQLRQVLYNLLGNAAHFTPVGGSLSLSVDTTDAQVTVIVADTGVGLAEEHIETIFEEFFKVDPSRHDRRSPGLGLSICKRIVDRHGGQIWARSAGLDRGTQICFTLPRAPAGDGHPCDDSCTEGALCQ